MGASKIIENISYIQQKDEFDYLKALIDSMDSGKCIGILLYGPPGTGKTLLATELAKYYNAQYFIIDGSPDLDRRDIEGYWELIKGDTQFNFGPLSQAIKVANKEGLAFVIVNEINAIRESEQISLNSLLSENHINLISKGFQRHELEKDKKLIIIGTMNKGVIGINKLQEAFEDRFIICPEINYPEKDKEVEIATTITKCSKPVAEIVVDAARQIRKQAIQDFSISKIFSTRLIVNFCMIVSKMSPEFLKNNIENGIINKLGENAEEKRSIAMILDGKLFESKLKKLLTNELDPSEEPEGKGEVVDLEQQIKVNNMRNAFIEYFTKYGKYNAFRTNGDIMWKVFEWMWYNKRKILQDYMTLTETMNLPNLYKTQLGRSHLFGGQITLRYIKWVYRNKFNDLKAMMALVFPVI